MRKADHILNNLFSQDLELSKAYKSAFSNILNQNDKSPQFLAIQCDILFKSQEQNLQ
jgi:succinate dehydrogenase flavin-adding protein (antitoxin of CptAB toxin-antitoxin module)